jgi:hypothetical protein
MTGREKRLGTLIDGAYFASMNLKPQPLRAMLKGRDLAFRQP